jgi:hypothetical protein
MGLLDQFSGMNPEQQQGLLAAAAQMLQASGPSRTPTSLGQIVGGGLGAFQGGMDAAAKRRAEEEAAKQAGLLRSLQIQQAQGGLAETERAREQQQAIQKAALSSMRTPGMMAGALPGGPTPENAAQIPSTQPSFDQQDFIGRVMQIDPLKGLELQKQFAKTGTEFDTKPQVGIGPDGKPFTYIIGKDGTVKRLEGTLPRDELKLANLGGRDVAYNPYALQSGQSFQRTPTPGESERLAFERSQVGKPTFNAEAGGFISPPNKVNPQGAITPLSGFVRPDKPLTEFQGKATTFAARMTDAESNIREMENKGISGSDFGTMTAGSPFTNFLATPEGQRYRQGQENWVTANLRQESGAAIGRDEMNKDIRKYFPIPGDSKEVIAQKTRSREVARQGMMQQAGPGAKSIPGIIGASSIEQPQESAQPNGKTATLSDIAATAKATGKTTAEVTADLKAKGYKIGVP